MIRCLLPLLVVIAPALAATFTVTSVNNSGAGTLRQAVLDANAAAGADEIVFSAAGVFATAQTITLSTPLEVRGPLTISAPTSAARQVTLRGAAAGTRLIQVTVSGVALTLRDLILENGKALAAGDRGGALQAGDGIILTLTAERCVFQDNQAQQSGAGISMESGLLTLTDCTFRRNTALNSAAVRMTSGFTIINACTFNNNTANAAMPGFGSQSQGSVITQELGTFTLSGSTLSQTVLGTAQNFPAVRVGDFGAAGVVNISDTNFTDNAGGGVSTESLSLNLTGCRFERNRVAVVAPDPGAAESLTMTDCVALENDLLVSWDSEVLVEDCRFDDNGGGVTAPNASVTLKRVKMRRNAAIASGRLTAEDCEFDDNSGGGISCPLGSTLVLRRCALTRNTGTLAVVPSAGGVSAGQLALVLAPTLHMESCTVSDNSGLIQATSRMSLYNCTFYGNLQVAPNQDGLLLFAGPDLPVSNNVPVVLKNCVFAQNSPGTEDLIRTRHRSTGDVAILSLGGNFIDRSDYISWGGPATGPHPSDQIATPPGNTRLDPLLGPLVEWGNAGLSRMPLAGSPLIDAGFTAPSSPEYQEPFQDHTGRNRVRGGQVDIGAVEARSRITVTNTQDSGNGSLREAITLANGLPDAEIVFSDATFGTAPQTITLSSGQIVIPYGVTITGPEVGVGISGNNNSRIFSLTGVNSNYQFKRIHFTRGSSSNDGGAISLDAGPATTLTLRDCVFTQNTAAARGGGLFVNQSQAILTNCQWSANSAGTTGGAIAISSAAVLRLTNSTLSGNSAIDGGGGLLVNNATSTLVHCTISLNTADSNADNNGNGGGIRVNGTTALVLGATVVSGNTDASAGGGAIINPDLSGAFSTLGSNFIGKIDGQTAAGSPVIHGVLGDQAGTIAAPLSAQLEALAENGGLFRTHKPLSGSPLIQGGNSALLAHAAWPEPPLYDSRLQFRELGSAPDIGAVEAPDAVQLRLVRDADFTTSEHRDEGQARFTLFRSRPGTETTAVIARAPASTAAAADVQLSASRLTETGTGVWNLVLGANVESKAITLNALDDTVVEPAETFILGLVANAAYGIVSTSAADRTAQVLSNDALVTNAADSGTGSLRAAFDSLAGMANGDIRFDPAFFAFPRTITLLSPLVVQGERLMVGPNSPGASLTLDGNLASELLDIRGNLRLTDLNLARGRGRIIGLPDIATSPIMLASGSSLEMERCCVRDCQGQIYGGAIFAYYDSRITAVNCTFARNQTTGHGGVIRAFGDTVITLTHCTLAENRADTDLSGDGRGGAIYLGAVDSFSDADATLTMTACLSSQNTDQRAHLETDFNSRSRGIDTAGANNAYMSGGGNFFSTSFDQGGIASDYLADLQLGPSQWTPDAAVLLPLGYYGGPTMTYALSPASPARGWVTAVAHAEDQRGRPRGQATEPGAYAFGVESYAYWKSYALPLSGPGTNAGDDFDGDGVANIIEQHLGTDPRSSNQPGYPRINSISATRAVNVSYPLSANVDPAALLLQQSTNLSLWTTANAVAPVTYSREGTRRIATFTVAGTSGSNAPKRFFRFRVNE